MVVPTVLPVGPTGLDGSTKLPTLRLHDVLQTTEPEDQCWYRTVINEKMTVSQSGFLLSRLIDARVAAPTRF